MSVKEEIELTEYKIIKNDCGDFLYYKVHKNFLWKKWFVWQQIPHPYFDKTYGRDFDITGTKTAVCSYNTNLEEFIKKYSDINKYFKYFNEKQSELSKQGMKKYWETLDRLAKTNK